MNYIGIDPRDPRPALSTFIVCKCCVLANNHPTSLHGLDLPDDLCRHAHGDRPVGDILAHDGARADRAPFADLDAGQHRDVGAEPAVVADLDGLRVLDHVATGLHAGLVRGGDEADARGEEHAVADGDVRAVEDDAVEVCVELLPDGDVAAVVDLDAGLDVAVLADLAEQLLDHAEPDLGHRVGRELLARHVRVEALGDAAGAVARLDELGHEAAVQHARDHALVVLAPGHVGELAGPGERGGVLCGLDGGDHGG
ncbi:hypothetical protein Micbo1qcDRAFT_37402 [Microdochium bolleyi]|uniref:Uncharacterized protein n=1 Tax=Microdochium bolleyi TaxID=196109 RepID=A0A136IM87_9PEZI|nr:hypothetical protein Micbo1qcDRAFT_37402 [Microdochium bolleyi]